MASKTITITQDAYDRLRALKREDETFSDVITRLTTTEDPMEFAGSAPGIAEEVEKVRDELEGRPRDSGDEMPRD